VNRLTLAYLSIASLVAEPGGVRDRTGPELLVGPCWVRSRRVNDGQQRAGAVIGRSQKPQVAPSTAS
jgi:hypothetical protein